MATTTPLSPQGLSYLMLVQDDPCWIWSTQSSEGLGGFCRRCQRLCWPPGGHQPWCPSHGPLCRPQKLGQCQPGNRPAAAAPSEPLPMGRWHLPTVQSISTQSTCCTNQFQSEFRFSSNIACSKDFENYAHKNTVNGEFTGLGRGGGEELLWNTETKTDAHYIQDLSPIRQPTQNAHLFSTSKFFTQRLMSSQPQQDNRNPGSRQNR